MLWPASVFCLEFGLLWNDTLWRRCILTVHSFPFSFQLYTSYCHIYPTYIATFKEFSLILQNSDYFLMSPHFHRQPWMPLVDSELCRELQLNISSGMSLTRLSPLHITSSHLFQSSGWQARKHLSEINLVT